MRYPPGLMCAVYHVQDKAVVIKGIFFRLVGTDPAKACAKTSTTPVSCANVVRMRRLKGRDRSAVKDASTKVQRRLFTLPVAVQTDQQRSAYLTPRGLPEVEAVRDGLLKDLVRKL